MAQRNLTPAASSLAALAGVAAACGCCLPLPAVIASAGIAGASALLASLRPWLLTASLLLLAFAFWQTYRRPACGRRRSLAAKVLLWLSLALIVVMFLFPQTVAGLLADLA